MDRRRVRSGFAVFFSLMMVFSTLFTGGVYAKSSVKAGNFKDVASAFWAADAITWGVNNGIIQGYEDGTFRPNQLISRIEFAVMINRVFSFLAEAEDAIIDVSSTDWYWKDALLAVGAGYLQVDDMDRLQPDLPLTRGEASLALYNLFSFDTGNTPSSFIDIDHVNKETMTAINSLAASGYIQGYAGNLFKPDKSLTRAELTVMLYRMIELLSVEGRELPSGHVQGNVVINQSGTILKNIVIEGNLYLTEGIGEGDVTLNRTTVKGQTFINGGGMNSIGIQDSELGEIDVNKPGNHVRIYVTGSTSVGNITLHSGAKLEELELTGEGFEQVTIPSNGSDYMLVGHFNEVMVENGISDDEMPTITITGTVDHLVLDGKSRVILSGNVVIKKLTITENASHTTIEGNGTIESIDNQAEEVSFNGNPVPAGLSRADTGSGSGSTPNPGTNPGTDPDTDPEEEMWTLVWGDEFDDGVIDPEKWTYDLTNGESYGNPGWGNGELEYYTSRPENVKEEDGNLIITARKESYEGFDYTSTRIKTKGLFSKKYGKFEIRASLPTGQGLWPAIWMMPESDEYGVWAASGELDIMEGWGSKPRTVAGTIHYGGEWPNNAYSGKEYELPEDTTVNDFHTYAIEWEPGEIRWYVDGELYSTKNDWFSRSNGETTDNPYPAPFDQEFHLIMNLAVGGHFDGNPADTSIFPKSFVIDYVRVYELTGRPYRDPVPPTVEKEEYLPGANLPLEDGNLVYNNDFTQNVEGDPGMGIPNTAYWAFYKDPGAEGTVALESIDDTNYAKVMISNAGSNFYSIQPQAIVSLAKGRYYKLTFSAKTDTSRTITARLTGGESRGFEVYSPSYTALLTNEMKNNYEMSFQMKAESDNVARVEFNMGTNDHPVWIGNVRLVEVDGIEPPPAADIVYYPLVNGDFSDGLANWETISDSGGYVTSSAVGGEAKLTISNQGTNPWSAMLIQNVLPISSGTQYTFSFDGRSTANRKIEIIAENASYYRYMDETADLTNETKHYSFEFTATDNDVVSLKYLLGLIAETTAVGSEHDVFIDNVVFEVKDAPVAKAPVLLNDKTDNKVGQDIEITFDDNEVWRGKITAVTIDGKKLAEGKDYTVVAGTITINGANFTMANNYSIRIEAGGFATAKVVQPILSNDGNLVINGDFSNGSNNWGHWDLAEGGFSSVTVEDEAANIVIYNKGDIDWHTQFFQEGIKLEAGKSYKLNFNAWSTVDRPINVELSNTGEPPVKFTFHLTDDSTQVYSAAYTADMDRTIKLNYLLGDVNDGSWTTPAEEHRIFIDNIVMKEDEGGEDPGEDPGESEEPGEPSSGQSRLGAGSYTNVLPKDANQIQTMIYKTDNVTSKMQTNDWWSNLAWDQYSEAQYPHPLAMKNQANGLRIYYPGNRITANSLCICGWMNDIHDFVVGHSEQSTFPDARVDDFSDWFVSALYQSGTNSMKATYGHGSPFVYFTYEGGNPELSFYDIPSVWSGDAGSSVLGITIAGAHYGLFGPTGSTWDGIGTKTLTNNLNDNNYFSVAVLPDNTEGTLNQFKQYAYSHVTDTKVGWSYDETTSEVTTTYTYITAAKEGTQTGTIFSLYPHQWQNTDKALLGYTYNSVRGLMKTAAGSTFQTTMKFNGVLPSLPDLGTYSRTKLAAYVDEAEAEVYDGDTDTYWTGKRLGKLATLAPIADQVGDTVAAEKFRNEIKTILEDWFTATDSSGELNTENLFYYNSTWGTLFGYPDSYGSVLELNDHHFHYGYFIKAAAEIARVDKEWASAENWGPMVDLLIRDFANWNRDDEMFPFLRNFDPYAGHSWASGHARFGDGNNSESSSEAMNAWAATILWGEATGNTAIRDLGIYQYTTEMNAINNYWFDVNDENFRHDFPRSTASMVWGGKTVGDGTWWTANPEEVHGINWLPITGASLYLTHYPAYANNNYLKMVEENGGTSFDAWEDLIYMYRAISNVDDAKTKFNARAAAMIPEEGNSKANAYHWIYNLDALGNIDPSVTANYPIYAVFNKEGVRTYLVYNMTNEEITVTFSDDHIVTVAPNSFNAGNGGEPVIPDTEAPTVPTGLTSTAKTTLTVTLSWNTSTDNEGAVTYDVYVDGLLKGSTPATSYVVNGLTPDTAYTFTVKAKDGAGNQSASSEGLTVTTNPAGEEPEVPAPEGPMTLYLVGDSDITELSTDAGTSANEVAIPSAEGGNHYIDPVNPIVYEMNNINAVYSGAGGATYQFYFDTVEDVVGTALMLRISYDFDGDGIWDRTEQSPTYALNPVPDWERFTQIDRGTVTISGSGYMDFSNGSVKIEIWNQLGTMNTKVKVNAPTDFSQIMFPYTF